MCKILSQFLILIGFANTATVGSCCSHEETYKQLQTEKTLDQKYLVDHHQEGGGCGCGDQNGACKDCGLGHCAFVTCAAIKYTLGDRSQLLFFHLSNLYVSVDPSTLKRPPKS